MRKPVAILFCLSLGFFLATSLTASDWQFVGVNTRGTISYDKAVLAGTDGYAVKAWVRFEPQKARPIRPVRADEPRREPAYYKELVSFDCLYMNSTILYRLSYDAGGRLMGQEDMGGAPYDLAVDNVMLALRERVCAAAKPVVAKY